MARDVDPEHQYCRKSIVCCDQIQHLTPPVDSNDDIVGIGINCGKKSAVADDVIMNIIKGLATPVEFGPIDWGILDLLLNR